MKKNTLMMALLAGALIAPELLAQQNPNRPQQPRQGQARGNIGRIAEQLELTEKQREQWAKIVAEQQQKQRALFQDRNTPREQVREKFNALRKETREKQEKILTKEQLAKYKELTQGRGQVRPGQGPGGRPGPGAGARPGEGRPGGGRQGGGFGGFSRNLFGDLDLSEKQQEKINAINQARGAEMRQMFEDLRNGGGADRQALTEKFRALGEKYQKQIEEVLTEEQKKKMAEMSAQGGRDQGDRDQGGRGRGNPFASLNLKEEQQKKLDAARQERDTQMRALFSRDSETPREERTAKIQKVREAYEATVKKVLTEEQMKKYQESRSAQGGRGEGQGRRPGQGGFGGRRNPYAELDLTKEQQAKLDKITAAQREEQTKLFQELRDGGGNREGLREKFSALREKYQKQIDAILTDEQKKKLQEQRRPGQGGFGSGRRPGGERPPQNPRPRRDDI
jgi:Spy/CpxP family protein refolding chaperone